MFHKPLLAQKTRTGFKEQYIVQIFIHVVLAEAKNIGQI